MSKVYPWLTEKKHLLLDMDGHDIEFDEVVLKFKKNDKGKLVLINIDGIKKGYTTPLNPWYLDLMLSRGRAGEK